DFQHPVRRSSLSRIAAYIVIYVLLYAAFGVASPFWPKFFETRGSGAEPTGPLVARLAAHLEKLRLALAIGAVLAAGAAAAFLTAEGFWLFLSIALVQ